MLEISGLAHAYGEHRVLDGLDLSARAGTVVVVRGPNGAGKSTLVRCVAGLLAPLAGTVRVEGRPVDDRDPRCRAAIAALLGTAAWYPNLTVAEHLELVRLAGGTPDTWLAPDEVAGPLGIDGFADAVPGRLSAGQRQRLALGMVFSRPSRLLLLDEPEQHLDADGRDAVATLVAAYARRGGAALVVTHDTGLAAQVSTMDITVAEGVATMAD